MPKLALRALGLVNPMMRGLAEMAYEFEEPFVLDTTKYQSTFGTGWHYPAGHRDHRHGRLVPEPAASAMMTMSRGATRVPS